MRRLLVLAAAVCALVVAIPAAASTSIFNLGAGDTLLVVCPDHAHARVRYGWGFTSLRCPGVPAPTTTTAPPASTTTAPATTTTVAPPTTTTTIPPSARGVPFADSSPWNTKLTGASFVDVGELHGAWWVNRADYSRPVVHGSQSDPLIAVSVPNSWGWPASTLQLRIPAGQVGSGGTDASIIIIDGTTAYDLWQFARTGPSSATAAAWAKADVISGSGWGTPSPFQAAGISGGGSSGLGGLLLGGELQNGIHHALALGLNFTPPGCPGGYVAPAINGDGACEGKRFGIPSTTAEPAGLSSAGHSLFVALQTYGAYSTDHIGGAATVGFGADPLSVSDADLGPLFADFPALAPLLRMVA